MVNSSGWVDLAGRETDPGNFEQMSSASVLATIVWPAVWEGK
jgi:hypothetical protein